MERHLVLTLLLVLIGFCCGKKLEGKCVVDKTSGKEGSPPVEGTISLMQPDSGDIQIKVSLKGFGPTAAITKHGFHVHMYGNISNGCMAAGTHYNPFNKDHGGPSDTERHVGDLGNLEVSVDGTVEKTLTDPLIKLSGDTSVIGKALVIHANEDDLGTGTFPDSKLSGHAGPRIACCEIVLDKESSSKATRLTSQILGYLTFFTLALMW
ncbi:hypothetical protein LSH36_33g04017 [Paralvinella palmiformis]|uniref:superoxide dismutase n=1 Tax=Paralvinella palmiformis TaxID=53620 RepID=A0AAD9K9G6_9ANNE|nr:hypothetical protein LSH36_33g04017 [Paralvinella palmiformis]